MLTPYRRHKKNCLHREKGRAHRRCACPIWVDGVFDGAEIRQSLRVRTWEDAEREMEKLKKRLMQLGQVAEGPITLKHAWDEFAHDAQARNLREATLRKYRYLRADMERFAAVSGLRFVHDAGWIAENHARKLKSPKVTPHPTLPFSREEMVRILAAVDNFGKPGSLNRRRMKGLALLMRYPDCASETP